MNKLENNELKEFIETCNSNLNDNPLLYEVSFLKIYVKFESFLSNMFEMYSLGEKNSIGYVPDRALQFSELKQLRTFLCGGQQKPYIEYLKVIETLAPYIFTSNPFNIIFEIAENRTYINKMIALRNHIAHESDTSKQRYISTCLNDHNYISPGEYLLSKNKKLSKSNYTVFIDKLVEISELIINPIHKDE